MGKKKEFIICTHNHTHTHSLKSSRIGMHIKSRTLTLKKQTSQILLHQLLLPHRPLPTPSTRPRRNRILRQPLGKSLNRAKKPRIQSQILPGFTFSRHNEVRPPRPPFPTPHSSFSNPSHAQSNLARLRTSNFHRARNLHAQRVSDDLFSKWKASILACERGGEARRDQGTSTVGAGVGVGDCGVVWSGCRWGGTMGGF